MSECDPSSYNYEQKATLKIDMVEPAWAVYVGLNFSSSTLDTIKYEV